MESPFGFLVREEKTMYTFKVKRKKYTVEQIHKGTEPSVDEDGSWPSIRINGGRIIYCKDIGGVRCKYIGKDFVVKINDYWNQTKKEIKRYKKISYYDRQYFPVLLSSDKKEGILIQERIKFKRGAYSEKQFNRASRIVERLIKKYKLERDVYSDHVRNWGFRENGRPVIFDFGI